MRLAVALVLAAALAGALPAQEAGQLPATSPPEDQSTQENPVTSLASEFLEHDFLNVLLFADLVYDTEPIALSNGKTQNQGGVGFDGGGQIQAQKRFRDGFVSLSYRGDYRDYTSSVYPSGTDQSLALTFVKRLGPRWTFTANANAGIFLYGGTFFAPQSQEVSYEQTNPFSTESKFLSGGLGLTYRQTRRLSYIFNGQFYLNRYNIPGSIGSTGATGSVSVQYRTTAKTTLGGTYSHTYFTYQHNSGQVQADTVAATLTHNFSGSWLVSLVGGATRTDANGTITIPVVILQGNTLLPGYETGTYNRVATFPSFQASLIRSRRRSSLSLSGGQGITSGNGVYLTSKNLFINGYYSYSMRRSNLSFGGGISHLTSVANNISYTYTSTSFSANYGYNLTRHLGLNARYDYVRYGTLGSVGSQSDNRLMVGLYFTSKSVPMTLF